MYSRSNDDSIVSNKKRRKSLTGRHGHAAQGLGLNESSLKVKSKRFKGLGFGVQV